MSELSDKNYENNYQWPPATTSDLVNFFRQKEGEDDEAFEQYSQCAFFLATSIDMVASAGRRHETEELRVPLKPSTAPKAGVFHTSEGTQATAALIGLAHLLTHAEPRADEITEEHPEGRVLWQGMYEGQPINFVEYYYRDEAGIVLDWVVSTEVPDNLVLGPSPQDQKKMFEQITDDIEALSTGEYDISELKAA